MTWRPPSGSFVQLTDFDLAKVGLIAVLESQAKATAAAALKGLAILSSEEWHALEALQFRQIVERLGLTSLSADPRVSPLLNDLEAVRRSAQDKRHAVVHGMWGTGSDDDSTAYDVRREKWLSRADIDDALATTASLSVVAKRLLYLVGELIEAGELPEGNPDLSGPSIRTTNRLVHI